MESFTAKGRMSVLLDAMPVRVILNEDVGLLGAAVRGGLTQGGV
jgi:glucokinase